MSAGNGYIIDAPRTGLTVQKIPVNTDWYAQTFDGAVRPESLGRRRGAGPSGALAGVFGGVLR